MNAQDANVTIHYRRKQGMRKINNVTIRYRRKQ